MFHVTTERKAKLYRQTGFIRQPVRGFDTLLAAMAWAIKTGRKVIYKVEFQGNTWLLPDHHNQYGSAYWCDKDVPVSAIRCEYSGGGSNPELREELRDELRH